MVGKQSHKTGGEETLFLVSFLLASLSHILIFVCNDKLINPQITVIYISDDQESSNVKWDRRVRDRMVVRFRTTLNDDMHCCY
jgi:hypothetical protein